ncbi:MRG/MORF4L-binding protein [Episyrphus balteatus]|uniref:MRG/MORF4L-binding protein n=1 Tax=Episyrphus balteatus TaxID=286459 RepID=UPI002485ECC5|nr:MRG/MORF4L-binding protein [Episyrphus balteatus]
MTMSSKEKSEEMEWSAEEEIQLFFALEGLKPVGVNKHFYMACIAERLSRSLNRDIPAEQIWAHLRTLYNLDVLDEMEPLPFPNDQKDFSLPETEFSALMSRKQAETEEKTLIEPASQPKPIEKQPTVVASKVNVPPIKDLEKKIVAKLVDAPKRTPKRTRGSMSLESNSPSTTPPPLQAHKRRRI